MAPGRSKDGADRRSPGRARFMGVLLILLSLIPAVLCYIAFAAWLTSDRERYRDYQAAEPCPAHATMQVESDCLSTWRFTVVKTVNKTGKPSTYEATLKDEDSWRGVVDFGDPGPLLERLEPGDRVTATIWRRDIVMLSKDGVRQNSSEAPRDELQMNAALGMLVALVAAQAFAFGAVRLVRPRTVHLESVRLIMFRQRLPRERTEAGLWVALSSLPPRQFDVIILRYLQKCETAQIGWYMGITDSTVDYHCRKVRERLSVLLDRPIRQGNGKSKKHQKGDRP